MGSARRWCDTVRIASGAAVKFFFSIFFVLALTLTGAPAKDAVFPKAGTPYADARADLLRQGLKIAPDERTYESPEARAALKKKGIIAPEPIPSPAPQFHEIDCWKLDDPRDPGVHCRALFLETDERGWKTYVIVPIDPESLAAGDIHYPFTVDGLPSIPGPFAKDVPAIRDLTYFAARKVLKSLGFRPARNENAIPGFDNICADAHCRRYTKLAETDCSGTGAAFCTAYWIAKDNRVLKVTTIWEYPKVYFAEWSSWKALKADFGKQPD